MSHIRSRSVTDPESSLRLLSNANISQDNILNTKKDNNGKSPIPSNKNTAVESPLAPIAQRLSQSFSNQFTNNNHIISNEKESLDRHLSPSKGNTASEHFPAVTSPVKVSGFSDGPQQTSAVIREFHDDLDKFIHESNELPQFNRLGTATDSKNPIKSLSVNTNVKIETTKYTQNSANKDEPDEQEEHDISSDSIAKFSDDGSSLPLIKRVYKHYPHLNIIISSILLWYVFSMGISVYNRWMFSNDKLNFKFPILITSIHQVILTGLSVLTLIVFPSFRLSNSIYRSLDGGNEITYKMSFKEYFTKIFPCSFASAGDIGLGNTSFRFITLSLYTMVKTSSLIFVLIWGVLFKLERFSFKILSIVFVMSFGVSLMVWGQGSDSHETKEATKLLIRGLGLFDNKSNLIFFGVCLVLVSACMSGLRWALTQIMLKKNRHTKNPILTIFYVSPGMFVVLLIFGAFFEGIGNFFNADIWEIKGVFLTIILILIPGFLAFFMTISEFILLQYASLLTLSIAGIFKELLTIFLSWVLFKDRLSFTNIIGLVITFTDIIFYNVYRFQQNSKKTREENISEQNLDNEFVDIEMNNFVK